MNYGYIEPVSRLLTLGSHWRTLDPDWSWYDYTEYGITAEHADALIFMACDSKLNYADGNSPEVWVPMHAMRAIGQFKIKQAVPALIS